MVDSSDMSMLYHKDFLSFSHPIKPVPDLPLDDDRGRAILKARRRNKLVKQLPSKDCGACGAPDCRTLADDIVRDQAALSDCPFMKEEK